MLRFGGSAGVAATVLAVGLAGSPAAWAGVTAAGNPAPTTATGTSLYVDVTRSAICSDSGPGTLAEPFCTVQHAASVVDPGQTVDIMSSEPDPVPQSVTITRSGTPDEPITFSWLRTASEPADPILSPGKQTGHAVITLNGVHDVTLSDLRIQNFGTDDGIDVIGSQDISVTGEAITHTATQAPFVASAAVSIDGGSSDVAVSRTRFGGTPRYAVISAMGAQDVMVTTNATQLTTGSGFVLNGTIGATVTSNTVLVECNVNSPAASGVTLAGGTSGTVENNVFVAEAETSCGVPSAGLSVDASSAHGVTADYNAFISGGSSNDYSWAGTAYANPSDFDSATGQGAHDLSLPLAFGATPPEGSPAIDSADCLAPGELNTDIIGNPRVRDPLATDASLGNGTCYADRGAYERQDGVPLAVTAPLLNSAGYPAGAVPYTTGVTITSAATSPWGEPVSYVVDFGDGSAPVPATPAATVTHQYTAAGQYTITVTASDTSGPEASRTYPVYALPDKPAKAMLAAAPDGLHLVTGITPDTADFTDTSGIPGWEVASLAITYGGNGVPIGSSDPRVTWVYVYARSGTYTATETVTDLLGRKSTATATITVGDEPQDVIPETDYGRKLAAHAVVKIPRSKLDLGGDADGALVDVIVTSPKKAGYVSVYPDGTPRPADATVRFQAGKAAENSALATGGTVDFYNGSAGTIHLNIVTYGIDDIVTTQGTGMIGDTYAPVTPARVLNTRIASYKGTQFRVAGFDHIPAMATDVVLDITVSKGATGGSYSVYPGRGTTQYPVTAGYWAKGQQVTNLAMVPVVRNQVYVENDGSAGADFTAFIVGYYVPDTTDAVFLPATSHRLVKIAIGARKSAKLVIGGKNGIPAKGTTAVSVNLTASGASAAGTIDAYADGTKRPSLVSLSYRRGVAVANAAIVAVGADGAIRLYNEGLKPVTVTVDLVGSYYLYVVT